MNEQSDECAWFEQAVLDVLPELVGTARRPPGTVRMRRTWSPRRSLGRGCIERRSRSVSGSPGGSSGFSRTCS